MRFLLILLSLLCAVETRAADAAQSHMVKVVSLNMCADPYLMGFAARDQIIALTPQSRNANLSPFSAQAKSFPVSTGQIEDILRLKPDLVIGSPFGQSLKHRILEAQGIRVLTIQARNDYNGARAEIIKIGKAIGRKAQARAYLRKLDAALERVRRPSQGISILPLERRGLTIGEAHILGEIVKLSGARLAHERRDHHSPIGLETAIAGNADFILTTDNTAMSHDRGTEFLSHPALVAHFGANRRLKLNGHLVTCAGATTPLAVRALIAQLPPNLK